MQEKIESLLKKLPIEYPSDEYSYLLDLSIEKTQALAPSTNEQQITITQCYDGLADAVFQKIDDSLIVNGQESIGTTVTVGNVKGPYLHLLEKMSGYMRERQITEISIADVKKIFPKPEDTEIAFDKSFQTSF